MKFETTDENAVISVETARKVSCAAAEHNSDFGAKRAHTNSQFYSPLPLGQGSPQNKKFLNMYLDDPYQFSSKSTDD